MPKDVSNISTCPYGLLLGQWTLQHSWQVVSAKGNVWQKAQLRGGSMCVWGWVGGGGGRIPRRLGWALCSQQYCSAVGLQLALCHRNQPKLGLDHFSLQGPTDHVSIQ